MLLHLRLVVPADLSQRVRAMLLTDPRVTHVVALPGAALEPPGDAYLADVAREAADEVIDALEKLGLGERGAVSVDEVDGAPYKAARKAAKAAPGQADDGVVWRLVEERAWADCQGSVSFYAFLTLATALAAIAVITDSAILVVGAMVVGPEFGPVAAIATGLVLGRSEISLRALGLLARAFTVAILIVCALALLARAAGWITPELVARDRPLTGFIWHPDKWSFVVAVLAGVAGVISLTAGKSSALVGVFISVTTVPAAGNLALALAVWQTDELRGAGLQLVVNLVGMVVAGLVTLVVQRAAWRRILRRGVRAG